MPAAQKPKGANPAAGTETALLTPDWRPFAEAILAAVEGCGWAGWRANDFSFRLRNDTFRRGVFAKKDGGTSPQLSAVRD